MDYGKTGAPKGSNHEPKNAYDKPRGAPGNFGRDAEDKAKLLAKMKANAEKAKKDAK
jgi:hypothetical protein